MNSSSRIFTNSIGPGGSNGSNNKTGIATTSVNINRWVLGDLEINQLINDIGLASTSTSTLARPHIEKLLHSPTYSPKILLKRREMLSDLSINSKQHKFVHHAEQNLAALGPDIEDTLWFLQPDYDEETEEYYGTLYFQGSFLQLLNESGWALAGTNLAKIYLAPFISLSGPVISAAIPVLVMRWWGLPISLMMATKMIWKTLTFQITTALKTGNPVAIGAILLYLGLYLWGLWSTIQTSLEKYRILSELRRRMQSLRNFLTRVQQIQQHPYNIHFHNPRVAQDVQELLANLQGQGAELYWFRLLTRKNPPNKSETMQSLALDPNALKIHKQLEGIVEWAQTLSGTLALARLLKRPDFCLPEWYSNPTPAIKVTDLRHTHLSMEKAVPNTVELRRDLLITGPNQGGKSTLLKSLLTAIWTAQTLGIVRAKSYAATPFAAIYSYIGLTDEVGKESLFQAEMNSVQEYLQMTQRQSSSGGFCIGFFDELFTSTNHEEGVSAALSVAQKLSTLSNSLTLITTHFPELGTLKGFDKARFAITEDPETRKIRFHYRLLPGISNQRVALRLMKERGFAPEIVDGAFATLQTRFPKSITPGSESTPKPGFIPGPGREPERGPGSGSELEPGYQPTNTPIEISNIEKDPILGLLPLPTPPQILSRPRSAPPISSHYGYNVSNSNTAPPQAPQAPPQAPTQAPQVPHAPHVSQVPQVPQSQTLFQRTQHQSSLSVPPNSESHVNPKHHSKPGLYQ